MATNNSKPVADLRIGAVKATIWENEVGGITRNNVTFSRLYRDEGQWKMTHSFGFKNLLTLAKLADQAHTLIAERNAEVASDDEAAKALMCYSMASCEPYAPALPFTAPNVVSPQHDISGHHKSRSSGVSSESGRTSCGRDRIPPHAAEPSAGDAIPTTPSPPPSSEPHRRGTTSTACTSMSSRLAPAAGSSASSSAAGVPNLDSAPSPPSRSPRPARRPSPTAISPARVETLSPTSAASRASPPSPRRPSRRVGPVYC